LSIIDQRVTLSIHRPRNPTLLFGAILFVITCVIGEILARTPFVQSRVPYQAYGMNHTQLELQLNNLKKYVDRNGAPDCFIFGSSQAFREVDPDIFTQFFNREKNESLTCYNFGVTGSQIWTTSIFGKILIPMYHPRLVVIGTSFLDYTEGREFDINERFLENDWLQYKTGHFNIGGWLTEHSFAWRTLTLISYSAPYKMDYSVVVREAHKWDNEIAKNGFALSTKAIDPKLPVEAGFVKNLRLEFGNFGMSERNLSALDDIVAFSQAHGAQVLMVEMTYHPILLELKDPKGNPRADREKILVFTEKVNARLVNIAAKHNIPFLKFNPSLLMPETGWFDLYHLNRNGALVFSRWLGIQAARILDLSTPVPSPSDGN
jgi:hypothetical protein